MEELTAALATSFSVTRELNTTAAEHPRFSQYKLKLSPSERQEARRRKILEIQKNRRFDFSNHARNLTEGVWDKPQDEQKVEDEEVVEEDMEVQTSLHKPGRYYKDQLMYSEWLVEVPQDLEKEWLLVVCPTGKRRLVIAAKGQTTAYSKGGFKCMTFPSCLPGGNRGQGGREYMGSTILDCLYCEKNKTYYVLDMMYWKNMPIYDSETEFRFYWMHEKLQEIEMVSVARKTNPYRFVPLPSFPCTAVNISNAISYANFDIDGLLFYHKRTHYTFGSTPLVVWLKMYMVPDVLNIAVPYKEVAKAPQNYTNYAKHLDNVKNQTYGSPPEKPRPQSAQRGRGRGRGGGRGRGDGQGSSRNDKSMDACETVEDNSAATTSLNFGSPDVKTPQTERGIIQMPKAFDFGAASTSPFELSSPGTLPLSVPVTETEAAVEGNSSNSAETTSQGMEMSADSGQPAGQEDSERKTSSKKSKIGSEGGTIAEWMWGIVSEQDRAMGVQNRVPCGINLCYKHCLSERNWISWTEVDVCNPGVFEWMWSE
ncbi:LOW QUALITY PROTEIN: snurportin-1-like [Haliotis rubra]|uniref:LOW QUALITY PROTEIN: snurportin-1-like n=1 Tax=Haliotis rubra TaxID=36100 RepID=UPI001EE5BDE3|nr:LOW QUALITY PROTEIN: snurportin-1-like [Haliotis rubra]